MGKAETVVYMMTRSNNATAVLVFDLQLLGTFGGLGAAGLSASLLTSVLPTTQEDLLALGLCSAGGYANLHLTVYHRFSGFVWFALSSIEAIAMRIDLISAFVNWFLVEYNGAAWLRFHLD